MKEDKNKKILITTPLFYANDNLHIGHCYSVILADVIARFQKLNHFKTYFVVGLDEHGEKNFQAASEKKETIKVYLEKNYFRVQKL